MSPRLSFTLLALLAAPAAGPGHLSAQEPNEKAARILEPLLKRPGSGPLFERFVNAWLDSGTLEELGKFLSRRVENESSASNRLLLALFHSRQGEPVKALEQFRAALATDPGSADIWYQKALLESRTLDFDAAIASLGKCLAAKPSGELPLQASQLLGRLQARAGRAEEALKTWRTLMDSRPADEELREDILELQISESLWPAARETAASLVEKTADPYRRVLRRMRLGDVLDRSGQRDKALETFAACLTDTGAGSWLEKEILSQMEKLFRREDDLSGLRAYFSKLLETHAHRAGLQRAQARLLLEAGETDAAIACGRALMALSPGDRGVREEFIALLTGAGRAAEAIPQVEQLLKQAPEDLELRLTLADLKYAAKDNAGALAALREYEQKAAAKDGTVLRVAGLMDRYGLTEEAVKSLRASLARADQPEQRLMLASLLHKSGDKEGALQEWRTLAASGALPLVQQSARAMQAHGETKAAWEMMHAAASGAEKDPGFQTQLCTLADEPERAVAALPSVRRLVELCRSAPDLNTALDTAVRVVRLSGREEAVIADLAGSAASAQAFCLLATLREAARDTIGANAALEKARALSPDLALSQLVRLWTMRGDFAQAAAVAENLFNSPGGRLGHVAETLASLHQRAGNPEAALRWTQEWRKLVPGAAAPVLNEARLLEFLDRENEALTALRSAAGRFEGNEDIRARLASLSLSAGRTAEALRYFSNLYEEAADLSAKMRWLAQWGEAAEQAGQLEGLISQFEERRRENRATVAPLMALAELHRIADNYEARRNALTEAARLKPDDPEIALEIARLESRENDDEAAIRTLRPLLARDTGGRVAALMADLLISSGQLEEGLKLITESTAASAAAVEQAALSLARRDEEKAALTFLRPHLAKLPDDWRLQYLGAVLEWRTGDSDAAAPRLISLAAASAPLPRTGAGHSAGVGGGQTYDDFVLRIMPPDVRRFFKLLIAAEDVNPTPTYGWGYGRQSIYTQLPGDPEEVQYRSAALLLLIAKSAPPEKREEWMSGIEKRGFPFARLYQELPPMRGLELSDRYFDFSTLLRAHPDNRPLLVLAAMAAAYRQNNFSGDPAIGGKAWAALKADAPQAGIFAALPGAGRGQPRAEWENEVLSAVENLPVASPLLVMAAVRSGDVGREADFTNRDLLPGEPVPAEWRNHMRALLERWRTAAGVAGTSRGGFAENMRAYSFSALARDYASEKEAAPLAALLESEWNWQAGRPQSPARPGSNGELALPLGFPPWFLPGLPDTLREFMQRYLPKELAAPTAALVREPLLRVLLASKAKGDAAAGAIKEIQSAPASTAVPFILGAAWEEKRGDFAAAAEQAVKALYMPVSQDTRRRLDGALAYWASKKGKPGDPLYNAGREAALRLRRDATTDQRRTELATLMDRLGLTAEADRLMRQGKAADPAAAANPRERLQRLLDDGKFKEALPPLISDMRGWAREKITHSSIPSGEILTEWCARVQFNGLLPQVMQALLPAQPSAQQMAEYAAACELTGALDQAREYYERALTGGVRRQVPQLLLNLTLRRDPARSLALLREFPDLWSLENVRRWAPVMTSSDEGHCSLEGMMAFAEFMMKALEVLPEKYIAAFPADLILELAGNEGQCGVFCQTQDAINSAEPSFSAEPPAEEKKRVEAVFAAWLDANEALSRRVMAIPGCGLVGWSQLSALWTCRKKDRAGLLGDGMAMLVRELKVPLSKRADNNDDSQMQALCFEFMQLASTLNRTEEFEKTVVPAVRDTRSPLAAQGFLEAWPLYETAPDKFSSVARDQLKAQGRAAWNSIIPAAAHRRLGVDLAPDLREAWTHPDPKGDEVNDYLFGEWLVCLEGTQNRPAAEQFFRDVMNGLLGTAAEQQALFREITSPRLESLKRLLTDAAEASGEEGSKTWAGFVLRWVRDEFLPLVPKDAPGVAVGGLFSEHLLAGPVYLLAGAEKFDAARAYLDTLPVTEDLPQFFCPSQEMMQRLSQAVHQGSFEGRAKMGLGPEERNLTFGRRVLRGLASRWVTGMFEELAGWEPRIQALPEASRDRLMALLRGFNGVLMDDVTPGGRAFYAWLTKEPAEKKRKDLNESIAAFLQRAAEGGLENEGEVASQVKGMLSDLAEVEHPRGREVIVAAHRSLESLGTREQSSSKLVETLLEAFGEGRGNWMIRPGHLHLPWQAGLLAAALSEGEPPSGAYEGRMSTLTQGLSVDVSDNGDLTVEEFLKLLGPHLQPGDARLLMLWVLRGARDEAVLRRVEELRGKTPYEDLRLQMEMALRFHLPRKQDGKPGAGVVAEESALPVEQKHCLNLLRDASLPAPLRLAMGTSILNMANAASPEPSLVHEVARQLRQALVERRAPLPDQEAAVFWALGQVPPAARDSALEKSLLPLTTLPRLRGGSYSSSVTRGLVALLDAALRQQDQETVDRLLEMDGVFPGTGALTVLARHGEAKRIAALLKDRPDLLQHRSDGYGPWAWWDEVLAAKLPAVVSEIADPLLRFETLATLTTVQDPDPLPAGLKPHRQRSAALAESLASLPWRSPQVRDRMVDTTLWADEPPPPATLPFMEEGVKRVPLDALARAGGNSASTGFHAGTIVHALTQGHGEPLLQAVRTLESIPQPRPEQVNNVMELLFVTVDCWLLDQWTGMTPEAQNAACTSWLRMLMEIRSPAWRHYLAEQAQFAIVLHALAGRMEDLKSWHAGLTDLQRAEFFALMDEMTPDDILDSLQKHLTGMPGTPEEKAARLRIVFTALSVNPLGGSPGDNPDTTFLAQDGATEEEFLKMEETLTAARPDNGWLAVSFASIHAENKSWDRVLARADAALTKVPPERDTAYAVLLELRTLALEHLGRGGETAEAIKALMALMRANSYYQSRNSWSRAAEARLEKRIQPAAP